MKKEHRELRRRPLLTPLWLTALGVLLVLAMGVGFLSSLDVTTVVVVRSAAKQPGNIEDPPLTSVGEQRAQALARMFGERSPGGVAAVFADQSRRAQGTAAPLAARLNLPVNLVKADAVDRAVSAIRQHRGGKVLVAASGDTAAALLRKLSGDEPPPVTPGEEAGVFVITIPTLGPNTLLRLSY